MTWRVESEYCWILGRRSARRRAPALLASQVRHGGAPRLFTYGHVPDVPKGVELVSGEEILPSSTLARLRSLRHDDPARPLIQLSDIFRVCLQARREGLWMDADVCLLRPPRVDLSEPYFAWEAFGSIGNSVLYLPPDHRIVSAFERLLQSDSLIPQWLSFRQRVLRPWWWRVNRIPYADGDIGMSMFGPVSLTRLALRYGCLHKAKPRKTFYATHNGRGMDFFAPTDVDPIVNDPGIVGLHISVKRNANALPVPGSLYEWAVKQFA